MVADILGDFRAKSNAPYSADMSRVLGVISNALGRYDRERLNAFLKGEDVLSDGPVICEGEGRLSIIFAKENAKIELAFDVDRGFEQISYLLALQGDGSDEFRTPVYPRQYGERRDHISSDMVLSYIKKLCLKYGQPDAAVRLDIAVANYDGIPGKAISLPSPKTL